MSDILGRTGGPFLDQVELEKREIQSAAAEGREPDFDPANLAPLAETVPGDSKPASLSQETVDELLADFSLTVNLSQLADPTVADVIQSPSFETPELIGETILTTKPVADEPPVEIVPTEFPEAVPVIEQPEDVSSPVDPAPAGPSKDSSAVAKPTPPVKSK